MHAHNFRLIKEDDSGIREICIECKFVLKTPKGKTGRIDNKKFLKEHIRDSCQPFGRTGKLFRKIYGDDAQYINKYKA